MIYMCVWEKVNDSSRKARGESVDAPAKAIGSLTMGLRSNAMTGQGRRREEDSARVALWGQFCRRRTISWDVADHGEVVRWPNRPTAGVGRSDHESVRLRGAAHAAGFARPGAIPPLALPARPSLAGARGPGQMLVCSRPCAPDQDAAGRAPAATA